jgi:hypothetical protein
MDAFFLFVVMGLDLLWSRPYSPTVPLGYMQLRRTGEAAPQLAIAAQLERHTRDQASFL